MEINKILRIITGSICILVAITRIFFIIFDLGGAMVYSFLFLDPNELVNIFEAILIVIFGFILTIFATIVAVGVYTVLGILQIALRKYKTPTIICTVFSSISIALSIRAVFLIATINEIDIFITVLMIMYIVILFLCIISYIKFRKQKND
ncbi:MAG: hypothetical protein R3255_11515 [Candidatus Lokiarchaeia archaeon]|nr:hypothetical protein [Candidatus Lokiarchaeia archaeon]